MSAPVGRSMPSVSWSANTDVQWLTSIAYTDSAVLTFNVSWSKADDVTSRLAGAFTVSNPTATAVTITSALVAPEFTSGAAAAGPGQLIDARCTDNSLAPGSAVNCSYTGTVQGGGPGSLLGQVMLSSGRMVTSAPTQFQLQTASSKSGSKKSSAQGCADIITGLFLSPALLLPGRAQPNNAQQIKACSSDTKQVSVTVGPFREDECGDYTVSSSGDGGVAVTGHGGSDSRLTVRVNLVQAPCINVRSDCVPSADCLQVVCAHATLLTSASLPSLLLQTGGADYPRSPPSHKRPAAVCIPGCGQADRDRLPHG